MKMVKSLLLGSAAGLLAMGGAQAADLPVKAKAVEYVRICSLYGAGFFYIPGTDTCIKLGGYLRADLTINGQIYDGPFWNGEGAIRDRYANFYNDRSRLALTIDTRTATEYGVVRTFGQADFQFSSFGATSSVGLAASVYPTAWQGQLNNDTVGNGYTAVELVFLQFAGFTFGKSASAYATPWHGYPGNNTSFLIGGYDSVTGVNNIQYTWQFGNGVSATFGIDESGAGAFNRTQIINAIGGSPTALARRRRPGCCGWQYRLHRSLQRVLHRCRTCLWRQYVPDFVGNIRVDQAWGLFQISGAVHDNHAGLLRQRQRFVQRGHRHRHQSGWCGKLRSSERCLSVARLWLPCRSRTSPSVPATTSSWKGPGRRVRRNTCWQPARRPRLRSTSLTAPSSPWVS